VNQASASSHAACGELTRPVQISASSGIARPAQTVSPEAVVEADSTRVPNTTLAVQVEPVGEFELKGIRRPLAAFNVISTNLER
jgi:class 3 adenylate cyclase